jgi:hypothetical protein
MADFYGRKLVCKQNKLRSKFWWQHWNLLPGIVWDVVEYSGHKTIRFIWSLSFSFFYKIWWGFLWVWETEFGPFDLGRCGEIKKKIVNYTGPMKAQKIHEIFGIIRNLIKYLITIYDSIVTEIRWWATLKFYGTFKENLNIF